MSRDEIIAEATALDPPVARFGGPALCVGVVSRNTVDALVKVADQSPRTVMLIASRRQVERGPVNGYVEGWSTSRFARYVRERDPHRLVAVCRDHGGPWQHPTDIEPRLSETDALASAFLSFKDDIDAGFDLLHIDTSREAAREAPPERALRRLIDLYGRCIRYLSGTNRRVEFEIGFEDQRSSVHDPVELDALLSAFMSDVDRTGLPRPKYVVAQTGTKVVETRNIGDLMDSSKRSWSESRLRALVAVCARYGTLLKAHNCDYLGPEAWRVLSEAGVGGANVAPEYGVVETQALLKMLHAAGLENERKRFIHLAEQSRSWSKWMAADAVASRRDRAIIAGHYVFSSPEVRGIRRVLGERLGVGPEGVDARLREAIEDRLLKHLRRFATPGREL